LTVSATSDNPALLRDSSFVFGGDGADRTLVITPATDQVGGARITLSVMDSEGRAATASFQVRVEDAPAQKGDFNGDGLPDLIFQDADGFLAAWLVNLQTMKAVEFLVPSNVGDRDFLIVGSGDFNADGYVDLALQFSDGALAVWYLQGKKLIGVGIPHPAETGDAEWRLVATADWDSDGNTDFLFQHRTEGTLAVWYLHGIRLTRTEFLTPHRPGGTWRVVSP